MLIDMYVKTANELMDVAQELMQKAEEYIQKGIEMDKQKDLIKPTIKKVKKKCKITNKEIAARMGYKTVTGWTQKFYYATRMSYHTVTRWADGIGGTLCLIDEQGDMHPLAIEPFGEANNKGFNASKFSQLLRRGIQDINEEDAEVWFE